MTRIRLLTLDTLDTLRLFVNAIFIVKFCMSEDGMPRTLVTNNYGKVK